MFVGLEKFVFVGFGKFCREVCGYRPGKFCGEVCVCRLGKVL